MTADLLDEGTKSRDALGISNALLDIGARMGVTSDWDASTATLLTLTRHIDKALDIYSDVLLNPAFPKDEVQRARGRRLVTLKQQKDDANAIASVVYASLLYGRNHPYGHSQMGDESSLNTITEADVRGH